MGPCHVPTGSWRTAAAKWLPNDRCHLLRRAVGVVLLEHERVADGRECGCTGGRAAELDECARGVPLRMLATEVRGKV